MAKLLFITQKVDKDDDVLGVYHRWIEELSKKIETISVICLYRGRSELPVNVRVFSLGKESGQSRIKYVSRFFKYIWFLREDYNTVFVHMNPIYILLGGLFWKASNKRIFLWYNHPLGNLLARVGIFLANNVFCTSPYSFSAKYRKTVLVPVGIDTVFFKKDSTVSKKRNRILYLGRISPIKHIDCLIKATELLNNQGIDFEVLIIGSPASDADKQYDQKLKIMAGSPVNSDRVVFEKSVANHKTPAIYNGNGVFVNLTPTGSFDKTILEAMACESLIMVSNKSLERFLTPELINWCMFKEGDVTDLTKKLSSLLSLPNDLREKMGRELRMIVVKNHNLDSLIKKLISCFLLA